MGDEQHYTFGDGDAAAERLGYLAQAFDPSTRAWLASSAPELPRGASVIDLGCGPGWTTALLAEKLAPAFLYGLELSERLAARAARSAIAGRARFLVHDVTQGPFPVPPAALLYQRFLLTHLANPARVLALWAEAAAPGGRLLLEETAALECDHPVFRRYYARVEALQAHYGQAMYIGGRLPDLARGTPWAVEHARIQPVVQPARVMARLHALNLKSWSRDGFAQASFDSAELAELGRALEAISAGAEAPPVIAHMAQIALVKTEADV